MTRENWKIFIQHAHAIERLSKKIEKAVRRGQITDARGAALIRACMVHEDQMEKLVDKVERAGVR
jgi:hypothetical protein